MDMFLNVGLCMSHGETPTIITKASADGVSLSLSVSTRRTRNDAIVGVPPPLYKNYQILDVNAFVPSVCQGVDFRTENPFQKIHSRSLKIKLQKPAKRAPGQYILANCHANVLVYDP